MDHKLKLRRFTDARVVQAVRRLKSTKQKYDQMEVGKNQEDIKYPNVLNRKSSFINITVKITLKKILLIY